MVKIKWHGIDKMAKTFGNAPSRTRQLTNAIVKNNAEKFMSRAKGHSPKDTRFLHDNIKTSYPGEGKGVITSEAGYSGFQEYGTRYQPGTPFFKPAMNETLPEFEKDFNDVIKGVFK